MKKVSIKNLTELEAFAKEFAETLVGGDVIGLIGDLGAGKTTFVQMLAKHLGVEEAVKSPTFILMQVFATDAKAQKAGVARICHVDAYRLESWVELKTIGFEEYSGDSTTVTLVEWADRVSEIHSSKSYCELTFGFESDDSRTITIQKR
jgi:tRNA threonylcarbamoyladenosine biosynthesis protein TsaE